MPIFKGTGYDIVVVDDLSAGKLSNLAELDITLIPNKVEEISVQDLKSIDVIVHLAAQSSVPLSTEKFAKAVQIICFQA